jgi:hypothetical protein
MIYVEATSNSASRSRAAYDQQVAHFKPYREHTIPMPYLAALQSPIDTQSVDPRQTGLLHPRLVNLLPLLGAAVPFAAHYKASAVYFGLRIGPASEDLAAATEYIQIINELIQLPCAQSELELTAPLLELDTWQVVDVGYQVSAPFDRAWSCIEETAEPCGSCRGCREREAAFQQAAKPDPMRAAKKS